VALTFTAVKLLHVVAATYGAVLGWLQWLPGGVTTAMAGGVPRVPVVAPVVLDAGDLLMLPAVGAALVVGLRRWLGGRPMAVAVRRALPRLALVASLLIGIAGCVTSHGNDTLTFEGRRYVLKVFLDDAQADRMRVRPYGEASEADPPWLTDRTVYRAGDIDPSQIVLVAVDSTGWDASESGSAAPAMAAFSNVDSDLTQPQVSELLAGTLRSPAPDRLAALAAAEARWESNGSETYRFTVTLTWAAPESSGPFTFFVRDGEAYEAYHGKEPLLLEDKTLLEVPRTVPELFAEVRRLASADGFDVQFDDRLGFPVELRVHVDTGDKGGWLVTDFDVVSAVP